ncbi:MAG: hypothetical protein ACI4OT_02910 [Bacilli bacterium]
MNKQLVELQRGCKATCVVILEEQCKYLEKGIAMEAKIGDDYLFARPYGNPIFREKLDRLSKEQSLVYFVINRINEINEDMQNRYIGLVKDREFGGYNLADNVIIVLTIGKKEDLKKISKELYHFCVVAF